MSRRADRERGERTPLACKSIENASSFSIDCREKAPLATSWWYILMQVLAAAPIDPFLLSYALRSSFIGNQLPHTMCQHIYNHQYKTALMRASNPCRYFYKSMEQSMTILEYHKESSLCKSLYWVPQMKKDNKFVRWEKELLYQPLKWIMHGSTTERILHVVDCSPERTYHKDIYLLSTSNR